MEYKREKKIVGTEIPSTMKEKNKNDKNKEIEDQVNERNNSKENKIQGLKEI